MSTRYPDLFYQWNSTEPEFLGVDYSVNRMADGDPSVGQSWISFAALQEKEEERRRKKAELKKQKREEQLRLMEEEAARKAMC